MDKNSVSRRAVVPWARRSLQCGGAINNAVDQQAANLHRSDFSDNNPPLFTNYKHSTCEKRTEEYWRRIETKENNLWMDHLPICSLSPVHKIQVISQLQEYFRLILCLYFLKCCKPLVLSEEFKSKETFLKNAFYGKQITWVERGDNFLFFLYSAESCSRFQKNLKLLQWWNIWLVLKCQKE